MLTKSLFDKFDKEYDEYIETGDFDEETIEQMKEYQDCSEASSKDSLVFDVATSRESVDTYSDSELGIEFVEDVSMVKFD